MKSHNCILSLLFIIAVATFACEQKEEKSYISYPEFYRGTEVIKTMLNEGDIKNGLNAFDQLADKVPYVLSKYYYTLAQRAAEVNQCERAAAYLKQALENGKDDFHIGTDFLKIQSCKNEIEKVASLKKEMHDRQFNYEYKNAIDSMFEKDRKFRAAGDESKLADHDAKNKKEFLRLYEKYGYPSEKIIGSKSAKQARILMMFIEPGTANKIFLPIFQEGYEKGYIAAREYAGFTDRRRARGINYTAPYFYEMKTTDYDQMIELEKTEINRRRDSIGLAPKPQ